MSKEQGNVEEFGVEDDVDESHEGKVHIERLSESSAFVSIDGVRYWFTCIEDGLEIDRHRGDNSE